VLLLGLGYLVLYANRPSEYREACGTSGMYTVDCRPQTGSSHIHMSLYSAPNPKVAIRTTEHTRALSEEQYSCCATSWLGGGCRPASSIANTSSFVKGAMYQRVSEQDSEGENSILRRLKTSKHSWIRSSRDVVLCNLI
jgi:hypothetical protein